jgi:hypothetical protein
MDLSRELISRHESPSLSSVDATSPLHEGYCIAERFRGKRRGGLSLQAVEEPDDVREVDPPVAIAVERADGFVNGDP